MAADSSRSGPTQAMRPSRATRAASAIGARSPSELPSRGDGPASVSSAAARRTTSVRVTAGLAPRARRKPPLLLRFLAPLQEAQVVLELGFLLQVEQVREAG